jgi:hypothetical protein
MPKNNLEDLRNHLFETIRALKDPTKPMDVDRARAVADVAGVILDSAKVEIGYMRVTEAYVESDFISTGEKPKLPAKPSPAAIPQKTPAPDAEQPEPVECLECGQKFDPAGMEDHRRRVRQTGRHTMRQVEANA